MKKLLILMLVLGLATAASATITAIAPVVTRNVSWDIVGPAGSEQLIGTNALGVTGNPANPGYGVGYGNSGGGAQFVMGIAPAGPFPTTYPGSVLGVPPNAGNLASVADGALIFPWPGFDVSEGDLMGAGTFPGNWYAFNIVGAINGDWIDIYDYGVSYTVPAGTLLLIPEPMTIALLGLGGLFLRRRK
jgi:hypothetical protein